jgi:uncharacterized membrane protein
MEGLIGFLAPDRWKIATSYCLICMFFLLWTPLIMTGLSEVGILLLLPLVVPLFLLAGILMLNVYSLVWFSIFLSLYMISCLISSKFKGLRTLIPGLLFLLISVSLIHGELATTCYDRLGCERCWITKSKELYPGACMFQQPCFLVPWIERHNAMVDIIECLCEKEGGDPEIMEEIEAIYYENIDENLRKGGIPQWENVTEVCELDPRKLKIHYV